MTATQNVLTAEASILNTVKAATTTLNAIGTSELSTALAELALAHAAALARLADAADAVRCCFGQLAGDASAIATQLQADLFGVQAQVEPPIAAASTNGRASNGASNGVPVVQPPAGRTEQSASSVPTIAQDARGAARVAETPPDASARPGEAPETVREEVHAWQTLQGVTVTRGELPLPPRIAEVVARAAADKRTQTSSIGAATAQGVQPDGGAGAARNGRGRKSKGR